MDDFARFFDNSLDLNGIASPQGRFRRVNIAWERTLGWTAAEVCAVPWLELVHPEDRQSTIDAGQRLFAGHAIVAFENRYRHKDGSYRLIQWHAEQVNGEAYCRGRDVTEERAQLVLRASLEKVDDLRERGPWFFAIFDNAPFAMALTKMPELVTVGVNDAFLKLFEFARDEVVGRTSLDLRLADPDSRECVRKELRERGVVRDFECVRQTKSGARVLLLLNVDPVDVDGDAYVLTSVRDITQRDRAEQERVRLVEQLRVMNTALEDRVRSRTAELSQTLREREALLREKISLLQEVHHRVKNNLQMISSLLNLQARQIRDPEARAIFLESQGRVRSIALLHENLYQSEDLGRVDMQEYVDKLVATLRRSYGPTGSSAHFAISIERVYLPVDAAVPCGLIVNELVTNALKHAWGTVAPRTTTPPASLRPTIVDSRDGAMPKEVHIEMRRAGDELTLRVADNGLGFAATVDPSRDETMGLTLVRDLTAQLRGHVEFATANGARCTVRFPAPNPENGGRS